MMQPSAAAAKTAQDILQKQADQNVIGMAKVAGAVPAQGVAEVNNEKIGGRYDPEEFDSMVQRLKKLAGVGVVGAGAASFAAAVASFGGLGTALGVSFGAAGAGLAGYKMSRRVGDVHEFEFDLIDCSPGLPVTICVHGWIDETDPAACSARATSQSSA